MDLLTVNDQIGEYPPSYYAHAATPLPRFAAPAGDLTCDVCVIGGGYTGLSAAWHLAERGYDVVLLEASRVGFGASGRNGGQVGQGQRLEQDALEARGDGTTRCWGRMGRWTRCRMRRSLGGRRCRCIYEHPLTCPRAARRLLPTPRNRMRVRR